MQNNILSLCLAGVLYCGTPLNGSSYSEASQFNYGYKINTEEPTDIPIKTKEVYFGGYYFQEKNGWWPVCDIRMISRG